MTPTAGLPVFLATARATKNVIRPAENPQGDSDPLLAEARAESYAPQGGPMGAQWLRRYPFRFTG